VSNVRILICEAKGKHCLFLGMRFNQFTQTSIIIFGKLQRNRQKEIWKALLYLPSCIMETLFEEKVTSIKFGGHSLYL
jgi:hypothetical protein